MHGKEHNEANQKNPTLMSRLETISQNLFWLGVAAPTCQPDERRGRELRGRRMLPGGGLWR